MFFIFFLENSESRHICCLLDNRSDAGNTNTKTPHQFSPHSFLQTTTLSTVTHFLFKDFEKALAKKL